MANNGYMSAARHRDVCHYVDKIQSLMNLSGLKVVVLPDYVVESGGEEVLAISVTRPNGTYTSINFSEGFFSLSVDEQCVTVCHELVHIYIEPMYQHMVGNLSIRDVMGMPAFYVFENSLNKVMEQTVDKIGRGWAVSLPNPKKFAE